MITTVLVSASTLRPICPAVINAPIHIGVGANLIIIIIIVIILHNPSARKAPGYPPGSGVAKTDDEKLVGCNKLQFFRPKMVPLTMFLQYRLQPKPADELQAKLFMILPLVMSVTFAFFPSGLVLYWVTNTLLSIAQQWNINRRISAAG